MKYLHDFIRFFAIPSFNVADAGAGGDANAGEATAGEGAAGQKPAAAGAGGTASAGGAGAQNAGANSGTGVAAGTGAGVSTVSGPLIGADGKFITGWSKQLGGTDALEAKFTDPKALVGSYLSLEKLISAKGVIPPGPNATPEQRAEFYKALGRPDKPEDYGISQAPEKLGDKPFPKELWDQERATGFSKVAHEIGLTKEQTAKLAEFDMTTGLKRFEAFNAMQTKGRADAEAALKAEWGPKYAEQLGFAQKAAKEAGGDELLAHPMSNDPTFIKAMAKVGAMIMEQPAAGARGTQAGVQGDPKAQIAAIMADKNHPWQPGNAKANPKAHDDAVKDMARLYALAYPG